MIDQQVILQAVISFFCGAIPFAIIAMWGSGIDIRKVGSGNPGFNNVLRVNKPRAVLTLIGDMAKGFFPLWLFYDPAADPAFEGWLYAFATVFGHCYTPFLKFNGGKGIATSAGVMLRLYPIWTVLGLTFFVVARLGGARRKLPEAGAIASVGTWVFFSLAMFVYETEFAARNALLMTAFLAWRHKNNIRNLIKR